MPTISVIVPVYNVEKYIHRCVDSILNQTFTDFELILVDDGSPDNCGAICDEYAAKDSRVRVIHQENGGLSAARNAGIDWAFENSDSEWITFVDSDDWVHPEYLEVIWKEAIDKQADIVVSDMFSFSTEPRAECEANFLGSIMVDPQEACMRVYINEMNRANYVSSCTKLYRKYLFETIRFPLGRLHEDQFTTYKVLSRSNRIVEIGRKLYAYFTNDEGIMHSKFTLRRYDNLIACEEAKRYFEERGQNEIVAAVEKRARLLAAQYVVFAKKEKLLKDVPKEYRMSLFKAAQTISEICGNNYSEYFFGQHFPRSVRLYSYLKKIKDIIMNNV